MLLISNLTCLGSKYILHTFKIFHCSFVRKRDDERDKISESLNSVILNYYNNAFVTMRLNDTGLPMSKNKITLNSFGIICKNHSNCLMIRLTLNSRMTDTHYVRLHF